MYFTSWDANVFLCLLSVFPEEVVRGMIKMVKETHEEFVGVETLEYWLTLPDCRGTIGRVGKANRSWWKKRKNLKEFTEIWKWRCPERRRNSVVKWATSDWDWRCSHIWKKDPPCPGKGTSRAGYWNSGEAWYYSINREDDYEDYEENSEDELTMEYDNKNTWERYRRQYVSDWYKNIHEGRYFLFFKENDILSSDVYDNYKNEEHATMAISDLGDRWQTAQDLLTIDGGGLGQKPGNHIEHIDDLF